MIGTTLENGSLVIAARPYAPDVENALIVLAFRSNHPHDKYVTWVCDLQGRAWSGHYYSDLREALDDFEKRYA